MFMYTPLQILNLFTDDELLKVDEYPQLKNNGRMSVEAAIASYVQMYAYKDDEP